MNLRILCVALLLATSTSCQNPNANQKAGPRRPFSFSKTIDGPRTQPAAALATTSPAAVASATAPTTAPATATANNNPELLAPTDAMTGYGEESYRLVSSPNEIIAVLKNGSAVLCKRVASPAVSVRAYVYTGGVYEGKWLGGGLSHLLEHLVVGGSNEKRTEEQNRDLLQKIGNDSNAYTTYDHTAYFINTTTDHLEPAIDLVCNWMLGAKITEEEYRREYLVVQRELEMGKGEPDRVFYYLTAANRYRVNPTRVPVIGYQEVIQGLSRDDVYSYYKLAYVPNNMVFSVAGDVDPEVMLAAVKKQVKHAKPGREFTRDVAAEPPVLAPRTMVGTFPKLGQAKLQLAFPTVRLNHPDLYALDLLATVLGGSESSLFVEELRDKSQLVSAVSVMDDTPSYVEGSFQVDMQLDAEKIPEASTAVLNLIEKVKAEGVDSTRLERAKTQVRAAWVKRMQTAEEVASALATDFMSAGDPSFSKHYVERIEAVTAQQVRDVARKYLDANRLLKTALLPTEFAPTLPKAEDLLRPTTPAATQPADIATASEIVKVDLGNDTTLLIKRINTTPLVVMQLYSLGGLTAEQEETNGLGNLTMQMVSRGTKTMNAQQIAQFWDSIGGEFEALSGNNTWSWTATCMKKDFEKAFGVFAEQVNDPTFPEAELPLAKRRIIAEIQGQDADWANQAFRYFKQAFYGQQSPYRFVATGTEQKVAGFTTKQVRDWYAEQIVPRKKVIAIFGDVDPKAVEELVRKRPLAVTDKTIVEEFAAPAADTQPVVAAPDDDGTKAAGKVFVEKVALNKTEQALAGVVIGYRSNSVIGEPATYPIAVGDTMASGYQYGSGYLYEILRGRGLVYVVHGQNTPGRRKELPGTFMVYAGCEPDKVNEVVDVILENIARLQGSPEDVNVDWFQRSKELIIVADALDNQTPTQQATQASLDELYGLGYNWHQSFADRIRSTTLDEVRKTAADRLSRCVVTVSTPRPDLVTVKEGSRRYTAFPKVELTPRGIQHDAAK